MIGLCKSRIRIRRQVVLTFLFLILNALQGNTQVGNKFRDDLLEDHLKRNSITDAKNLLAQKKDSILIFDSEKQAYYFNKSSQVNLMDGDFKLALSEAKNASKALNKVPNSKLWGDTYRVLSFAYIRNGKLDSALIFAEKLYDFTQTNGDPSMKRAALLALGNISLQNKSYQKSLEFYTEMLRITENLNDSINLKTDYYNVGLALSQVKQYEKSNTYLLKAAERAEKDQALDLQAYAFGTIADNYLNQDNFDAQEIYLKKANEIATKIGNKQLLAMGFSNLTETALRKGDFRQAVIYGNQSLEFMSNRPVIQLQAKVDSMLFQAHKNLGDFKTALTKLEEYDEKKYTIRSDAQKERLEQLTVRFEVEKKDLIIANQESSIREEKSKSQAFLAGIAFLLIILFFVTYINIKNSRTRKLLYRKEKELDQVVRIKTTHPKHFQNLDEIPVEIEGEDEKDYAQLFNEILEYIQINKLYLDPKLNQQTLISDFGTNKKYLYKAISKNGDDNFRGLINRFRINEAKAQMEQLIKNGETVDFSTLAEKVGFNSYATFYRAFKSFTGLIPVEFNKELIQDILENKG